MRHHDRPEEAGLKRNEPSSVSDRSYHVFAMYHFDRCPFGMNLESLNQIMLQPRRLPSFSSSFKGVKQALTRMSDQTWEKEARCRRHRFEDQTKRRGSDDEDAWLRSHVTPGCVHWSIADPHILAEKCTGDSRAEVPVRSVDQIQ